MARYPGAVWKPLPEAETQPKMKATQVIYHSIVGSGKGAYNYFRDHVSLESHFIVFKDGTVWQLIDTDRTADANYKANVRAISIETEDNGKPDSDPWTTEQVAALIALGKWCAQAHSIPVEPCPEWDKPGFGYHSMFGAPSNWTPSTGKTCPGTVRISQWHSLVMPKVAQATQANKTTKETLTMDAEVKAAFDAVLKRLDRLEGGPRRGDHADTDVQFISLADVLTAVNRVEAALRPSKAPDA